MGFKYNNGEIDISNISKEKLFGKIRRKARYYRRLHVNNNIPVEQCAIDFINTINLKLYNTVNERNWILWYFPVITTANSLKEIDKYIVQYIRYIFTGNFSKKNYTIKYECIKSLGFISLVNTYYKRYMISNPNKTLK